MKSRLDEDVCHSGRRSSCNSEQSLPSPSLRQILRPAGRLPRRPEQGAAALLHLVDEEGKHHQGGQHVGQVLATVPEIMFQFVSLILRK